MKVPGVHDVVAVAAGVTHSLALTATGEVWAWGLNHVGQLGTGTTVESRAPVRVPGLSGVISVAAGQFNSLVLTADGRVWSWGFNAFGQLGTGSTALFDPVPKQPTAVSNIVAIAAGGYHSLAVERTGMVVAWGLNHVGQLGDGTTRNASVPTAVRGRDDVVDNYYLLDVVAITAGGYHTLVVRRDGQTVAFGWNHFGQLGTGTTVDRNRPTLVPGLDPGFLAAGLAHSLAVTARGG